MWPAKSLSLAHIKTNISTCHPFHTWNFMENPHFLWGNSRWTPNIEPGDSEILPNRPTSQVGQKPCFSKQQKPWMRRPIRVERPSFLGKIEEATGRCCSVSETNGTEQVRILVKIYLIEFSAGLRNCRQTTDSQKTTRSYFNHGKNLMTSQWDPVKHGLVTSQSTGCIGRPFGLSFLLTSTPNWILKTIHATIWPMHIIPRIFKAISLSTGHLS